MPKTIDITELILRDAHQSVMATRMAIEDMVPACEDLDRAGLWSLKCWGGATFDYLKQNGFKLVDKAPRKGSRGTMVFFIHPKATETAAFGYLIEVVQEGSHA